VRQLEEGPSAQEGPLSSFCWGNCSVPRGKKASAGALGGIGSSGEVQKGGLSIGINKGRKNLVE